MIEIVHSSMFVYEIKKIPGFLDDYEYNVLLLLKSTRLNTSTHNLYLSSHDTNDFVLN